MPVRQLHAKLAYRFKNETKVLLAAADTFRAAAIDQLQIWADRIGVDKSNCRKVQILEPLCMMLLMQPGPED